MKKLAFNVTQEIDRETGEVVAAYFYIRRGRAAVTREVAEGKAFADYDRAGRLLGVELLEPCRVTVLTRLARREPGAVRRFLRDSVPRKMAVA